MLNFKNTKISYVLHALQRYKLLVFLKHEKRAEINLTLILSVKNCNYLQSQPAASNTSIAELNSVLPPG